MKKIAGGLALIFILMSCSNGNEGVSEDKPGADHIVDTSVIGSDNPNPIQDTTDPNYWLDSLQKK